MLGPGRTWTTACSSHTPGGQEAYANEVLRLSRGLGDPLLDRPEGIPAGSDWVDRIPAAVEHADSFWSFCLASPSSQIGSVVSCTG
jgi:hypothetical protein